MDQESSRRRQQGRRLKEARIAAGYRSAREAALENDWPESTYRAHEAGTRTVGQDDAERYARRFRAAGAKITGQSILFGIGLSQSENPYSSPSPAPKVQLVPLLDMAFAGRLAKAALQIPVEGVPLLAFADLGSGDFFALRIEDDAMDRLSAVPGSTVVVNRDDRDLTPDKGYVFSLGDKAIYRLWQPDPPHLAPYSTNPVHKPIFIKGRKGPEVVGRVVRTVLDL